MANLKSKKSTAAPRRMKRLPKGPHGGIELLLVQPVEHLGKQGDVVEVKHGYALNYLIPQGLATVASEHHKRMVEKHRVATRSGGEGPPRRTAIPGGRTGATEHHHRGQRQ